MTDMYQFVEAEDYKVVIGDLALKVTTQTDPQNRANAEREAIEEISGYLRHKYDCNAIFSASGTARNPQILMYVCDIALYHMAASASGRMGAEVRKERYDRAIKWLESVQNGKIVPDLPLVSSDDGDGEGMPLLCGSETKINNVW